MTEVVAITAEPRDRGGKGPSREARRQGRIPAVIYGNKEKPVMITLDRNGFTQLLRRPGFFTHLFDVSVAGATHRVLPRDVQFDPVTDVPLHVDFLRVSAGTTVTVMVPIGVQNAEKSPGLKRGGTINYAVHEVEVHCAPTAIPDHIYVDLEGMDLGQSVHVGSLKLPAGVTITHAERDFTILSIVAPSAVRSDADEAGEAAKA